jgi:hypothetical protein
MSFGSPIVREIELTLTLASEWTNVLKWLSSFYLLRTAGLEEAMLHRPNCMKI